jgi:hypothetical protein
VVNATGEWEEREYAPSKWVTTEVQSILLAKATTQGFMVSAPHTCPDLAPPERPWSPGRA